MEKLSVFSKEYWRLAAENFFKSKMLVFAALICALRIAVKSLRVTIVPQTLYLTFDPYVNALGSLVYGPLVGLAVGAVSDTIGALLFPSGAYFFRLSLWKCQARLFSDCFSGNVNSARRE